MARMKRKARKRLLLALLPAAAAAAGAAAASCSQVIDAIVAANAQDLTLHALRVNEAPAGTPYALADELSYSLLFYNDGTGQTASGTGWLFDYLRDAAAGSWTGYFGTNLHVGQYADKSKTEYGWSKFALGKRTSGGSVLYRDAPFPAAFYAGTGVSAESANGFVDFAVLKVTLPTDSLAYTEWAQPSVAALEAAAKGDYANLFYVPPQSGGAGADLSALRAFTGGYPVTGSAPAAQYPWAQLTAGANNPQWTINELAGGTPTYAGEPFDANDIAASLGIADQSGDLVSFRDGKYDTFDVTVAESRVSESVVYGGQARYQEGPGYVMLNSNLQAGASGSSVLGADGKIMGVYFGSWNVRGQLSYFGLMQPLIVSPGMAATDPDGAYRVGAYDLIAGAYGTAPSYKSALAAAGDSTYLFPAAADGGAQPEGGAQGADQSGA